MKNIKSKTKEKTQKEEIINEKQGLLREFKDFIDQYSIISLAIGLVIGNTTQGTVKNLVDGLITPFLSIILKLFFSNLGSIGNWTETIFDVVFKPGIVIQSFLEFLIVLFIIYIVVKKILHREDILIKKK